MWIEGNKPKDVEEYCWITIKCAAKWHMNFHVCFQKLIITGLVLTEL